MKDKAEKRNYWLFFTYILLGILLLILNDNNKIKISQIFLSTVLFPIQKTVSITHEVITLQEENSRLKQQLAYFKRQIFENIELLEENRRLRQLLNFKTSFKKLFDQYQYKSARVIAYNPSLEYNTIMIDKGSKDGIKKNMPVMNENGLIGKTFIISPFHTLVLLITDKNQHFSILLQKSRIYSTAQWKSRNIFELLDISVLDKVKDEDLVITSGLGGCYPMGIPVGKVIKTKGIDDFNMRKRVEIVSYVDFNRIEDVIILLKEDEYNF